ncbi:hypothetical protein [Alkaliphilus metalliredigens]|uniref:hypothetical protein n=1 Tax=Alkaliphilus metalliredigens TaxID=208226 RepID=UPI00031B17A7|nr:hypothetical protein [Alkaliphilus metalliredigens]
MALSSELPRMIDKSTSSIERVLGTSISILKSIFSLNTLSLLTLINAAMIGCLRITGTVLLITQ